MLTIPIPHKFQIFGHTYKVRQYKRVNKGKDYGEHDFNTKKIKLERSSEQHNQDKVEETYLHEIVHCILDHLGYDKTLSADEKFVEQFSRALHQILKTSEYGYNDNSKENSPGQP